MHVLGLSCHYHDAAAALLRDGQLVAAAEEERFSRKKHDAGFPRRAIDFCLAEAGIRAEDLDWVVFYEKPFVKLERIVRTALEGWPAGLGLFRRSMTAWLGDKLWVKQTIHRELGVARERILFADHHVSHAASAFLCSPFREAAVLTVDGVGEWATATWGVGRDGDIALRGELRFPHSLGLLYSAFTAFLGFEVNEGEYKVMGMAPYGTPRYRDRVEKVARIAADGSVWLDLDHFAFQRSPTRSLSARFIALFGEPRAPEAVFDVRDPRSAYYADVAASIQSFAEDAMLAMARHVHRETGLDRLCLAGGVALNSVANYRLLTETPFRDIYVHPAAGDSGGALGAALWVQHSVLRAPRAFVLDRADWGRGYDDAEVEATLAAGGVRAERLSDAALVDCAVDALLAGRVLGWFQGRFEWGPRTLGHRSILADPRRADMRDRVNAKIKFREPFRPFAPSVPVERAAELFRLPEPVRHLPARFMLYVAPVRDHAVASIPAVTHGGTARLQAVSADVDPLYHALITRFGEASGVPVVLNTSFNLRGEPIVGSPADALRTFAASGMDELYLGRWRVTKAAGTEAAA